MSRTWPPGTRVLVVEDSLLTARLLRARLEAEELEVLVAGNGLEALKILETEKVHIVSSDLMMPGMDGYRLIREIRHLPKPIGNIPILVLSVNQDEDEMVRCFRAGANDYVTKPFAAQVWVERLWKLFNEHQRLVELEGFKSLLEWGEPNAQGQAPPDAGPKNGDPKND